MNRTGSMAALLMLGAASAASMGGVSGATFTPTRIRSKNKKDVWNHRPENLPPREKIAPPPKKYRPSRAERKRLNTRQQA